MLRFWKRDAKEETRTGEVPTGAAEASPEAATRSRPSWRERLAGSFLGRTLRGLFERRPLLDEAVFEELETLLLTGDTGVATTEHLIGRLRKLCKERRIADSAGLVRLLREELLAILAPVARPLALPDASPAVVLVVGVNGVGKTTTIGKLAHRLRREGHSVLLAAGDTFRAAAIEQLKVFGERVGVPVIAQGPGSDAAAVVFDALQSARSRGIGVVIADTAGRLHNQAHLMAELSKLRRVIARFDPAAPHETLLVLDASTGQNAIQQLRQFREAAGVTGLVLTKLDGSAKGGVLLALAREFGLPVRFVGLGEGIEDLEPFDPEAFVDGLLPDAPSS
jgi:fused signal recognition particle receptor